MDIDLELSEYQEIYPKFLMKKQISFDYLPFLWNQTWLKFSCVHVKQRLSYRKTDQQSDQMSKLNIRNHNTIAVFFWVPRNLPKPVIT